MRIDAATLLAQYRRALAAWPWLPSIEHAYGLPAMMLFAVGSRETNLHNEIGDGGHGHGVWQLDNRSHTIAPDFDRNVHLQATTAARMLAGLLRGVADVQPEQRRIRAALVGYNAGAGTARYNLEHGLELDTGTANGDYSADTYERMITLQEHAPAAHPAPTLNSTDVQNVAAAVVRELLAAHAESVDGRGHGTVSHLLGGTYEYAAAVAHHLGVRP